MPAYSAEQLNDRALDDLLQYLTTLRRSGCGSALKEGICAHSSNRTLQLTAVFAAAATWSVAAQQTRPAQVTAQDLRDGLKDATRWLTYSGDYTNHRHSPLTQITPENVHRLTAQWAFQTDTLGKFEATPLVVDGIIYITGPLDTGWAIDARTGRQIWRYRRELPGGLIACCGLVNRGFGVLGDRLFKTTLDAHVVAHQHEDRRDRSGTPSWRTTGTATAATTAPLVVKDKVVVGIAGAEYGVRGFIDAYDAQTGKRGWRFYTTAGPEDPGHGTWRGTDAKAWENGGGSIWVTGAYDPELNLVYWGTGNAGPDYDGERARRRQPLHRVDRGARRRHRQAALALSVHAARRLGLGLDADAGAGRPDASAAQPRKVVMFANRNGFFYVLDRATGQTDPGQAVHRDDAGRRRFGPTAGPMLLPNSMPSEEGTRVCPDQSGGTNWMPPSFDPALGLLFVTARESCGMFFTWKDDYNPGDSFRGGAVQRLGDDRTAPCARSTR